MALRHDELPASLNVSKPSELVDWESGGVEILTEPRPWPAAEDRVRRAGVSSFGISGTNAHIVLAEAPADGDTIRDTTDGTAGLDGSNLPWVLSARSADALAEAAGRLAEHVRARPELSPADVAF